MFNAFDEAIESIVMAIGVLLGLLFVGVVLVLFTNVGCATFEIVSNAIKGDPLIPTVNEIVMPPNATIKATTDEGTIIIKSGKGLKRYYMWDEATRSVIMKPRIERWYGSFGIYYPGSGEHWFPVNGITRGVLHEGRQYFDTTNEAEKWIKKWYKSCVYKDNGLLVDYYKTYGRKQLNVEVWQIYIKGEKPANLRGSTNSAIITSWDDSLSIPK